MSRGRTTLQPGERFVYSRSSGCGVRRSVRHPSAAHFLEDARGMQCEIWSESGRDQSGASGRFLLLGFDQSVSAAARFKTHERLSACFGERAMPPSDRVVVQQEHRGDFRLRTRRITRKRSFICPNSYQPRDSTHQSPASKAPGPRIRSTTRRISWMFSKTQSEQAGGRHPVASGTRSHPRSAIQPGSGRPQPK